MLLGSQGFASAERMRSGLSRETALRRVDPLPYTLYGLLWHIEFCQAMLLRQLAGEPVQWPPAAEQWPHGEPDEATWQALLDRLRSGLAGAGQDTLEDLCAHNAHHWGQLVMLRRLLNDWPEG